MTPPDNILTELNELNSSLATVDRTTPIFTVPPGFFESFADRMIQKVRSLEGSGELTSRAMTQDPRPRDVQSADVNEELSSLSPFLKSISRGMPFSAPAGYFDTLETMPAAAGSMEELSPLLLGLRHKNPFQVPDGYFEQLAVGPRFNLESLRPVNPYTVPANYFTGLDPMTAVRKQQPVAKVVGTHSFKWVRYAAAAVVITFVSVSAFFFINRNNTTTSEAGIAGTMQNVSTKAIDEVIELADAESVYASNAADKADISKLMQDVPDKDIQEFLNETEDLESDTGDDPLLN